MSARKTARKPRTAAKPRLAVALVDKVHSLTELWTLAQTDKRYERLLVISARNLGCPDRKPTPARALLWLNQNVDDMGWDGVLDEVNACRDLVGQEVR